MLFGTLYYVADVANVCRHKSYPFCSTQQKKREQRDDDIRANIKAFHGFTRFGRNS